MAETSGIGVNGALRSVSASFILLCISSSGQIPDVAANAPRGDLLGTCQDASRPSSINEVSNDVTTRLSGMTSRSSLSL